MIRINDIFQAILSSKKIFFLNKVHQFYKTEVVVKYKKKTFTVCKHIIKQRNYAYLMKKNLGKFSSVAYEIRILTNSFVDFKTLNDVCSY